MTVSISPLLQPVAFLLLWQTLQTLCAKCRGLCTCLGGGKGAFREMSDMILHAQGKDEVYNFRQRLLKSVKNMGQ